MLVAGGNPVYGIPVAVVTVALTIEAEHVMSTKCLQDYMYAIAVCKAT